MNPGPVEEVGSTARSAIAGLATNPTILALVVMQAAFIIGVGWIGSRREDRVERSFRLVFERCIAAPAAKEQQHD